MVGSGFGATVGDDVGGGVGGTGVGGTESENRRKLEGNDFVEGSQ